MNIQRQIFIYLGVATGQELRTGISKQDTRAPSMDNWVRHGEPMLATRPAYELVKLVTTSTTLITALRRLICHRIDFCKRKANRKIEEKFNLEI